MNIADILGILIGSFGFLVSTITFYFTLGRPFRGIAHPGSKLMLTWLIAEDPKKNVKLITIPVDFLNRGARPGKIDDLILEIVDTKTGNRVTCRPYILADDFDLIPEDGEDKGNFIQFSSIWLNGNSFRSHFIAFRPENLQLPVIDQTELKIKLLYMSIREKRTHFKTNNPNIKWKNSPIHFSFILVQEHATAWDSGNTIYLTAKEIEESRYKLFSRDGFSYSSNPEKK